ncbi:MAG: SMC-Scp complex subunit ScpB [Candidatus Diapherotrites archaeon]|uniref:SMC-Scp complex subunit ScpB n=1 Tax=Candidatus Iainarchaeum sp. TaxID=3101447 RepID=A0A8T4C9X3_9ARCH|nr:SMC-Scp complex subunit ScpB [Candidatus Diapherotrites archaeon]
MVLNWLKKILQPETKKENNSLHTMGPEELLAHEEMNEDDMETSSENKMEDESEMMPSSHVHEKEKDEDETPRTQPGKESALKIMEAALFMGGKGLSIEELGKIANVPLLKTREYLPELVEVFNARNSALEIVEDAGGYRMRVRSPFDEKVSHLAGVGELNPAEMKTLAFIAYKQPLLQSHLVQVRSNTAYDHLQKLVETGFVSREPRGRTYVLRTTKKFAEYFGTNALKLKPITAEMKKEMDEIKAVDQSQSEELS